MHIYLLQLLFFVTLELTLLEVMNDIIFVCFPDHWFIIVFNVSSSHFQKVIVIDLQKHEKINYTLHVHVWKDKTVSTVTIGMYIYHGHESIYITRYMAYSGFIKYESGNGWRSILLDPIDPSFMQLFWEVFSKHDASERIWISLFAGKYAGAHWENILRQS